MSCLSIAVRSCSNMPARVCSMSSSCAGMLDRHCRSDKTTPLAVDAKSDMAFGVVVTWGEGCSWSLSLCRNTDLSLLSSSSASSVSPCCSRRRTRSLRSITWRTFWTASCLRSSCLRCCCSLMTRRPFLACFSSMVSNSDLSETMLRKQLSASALRSLRFSRAAKKEDDCWPISMMRCCSMTSE